MEVTAKVQSLTNQDYMPINFSFCNCNLVCLILIQEGAELLEGHDRDAGTRAEAKAVQEAIKESTEENGEKEEEKKDEKQEEEEEEEKPDLKRKTTMDATVEVM